MKWGLDFVGFTKLARWFTNNTHIFVVTNYVTKLVEAKALMKNIVVVIINFSYDYILTRFGCPLTLVTNHGVHFINTLFSISSSIEAC
jgi:hypothetical protein